MTMIESERERERTNNGTPDSLRGDDDEADGGSSPLEGHLGGIRRGTTSRHFLCVCMLLRTPQLTRKSYVATQKHKLSGVPNCSLLNNHVRRLKPSRSAPFESHQNQSFRPVVFRCFSDCHRQNRPLSSCFVSTKEPVRRNVNWESNSRTSTSVWFEMAQLRCNWCSLDCYHSRYQHRNDNDKKKIGFCKMRFLDGTL